MSSESEQHRWFSLVVYGGLLVVALGLLEWFQLDALVFFGGILLLALLVLPPVAIGFAVSRNLKQGGRSELIKAAIYAVAMLASPLLPFTVLLAGLGYMKSVENDTFRYRAYLTTMASRSYLEAMTVKAPCLDKTYFAQEFLKNHPGTNHCSFADVSTRLSLLDLALFRGPELTVSFRADYPHSKNDVARDLDRRCEILEKLGIAAQQLIGSASDDCRPGAFQVVQNGPHLVIRVRRNPFH